MLSPGAVAEEDHVWLNTYGFPGLVEMPGPDSPGHDDLSYSITVFRNVVRHALTFQLSDRLTFGLRYNLTYQPYPDGRPFGSEGNYDRSLSFQYRLVDEGRVMPEFAVGISDFLGTGRFESEYFVASKHLTDRLVVSGGIGWGRLASAGGFPNPLAVLFPSLEERAPRTQSNTGGEIDSIDWFAGDTALFGGIAWQATDRLRIVAEYSSDNYPETEYAFVPESPYNLSLDYALTDASNLRVAWLYGAELALQYTHVLNPGRPAHPSGLEPAGPLVRPRPEGFAAAASWTLPEGNLTALRRTTAAALDRQGVGLHGLTVAGTTARIEIENRDWLAPAQALGRTARTLTATLPPEIDRFDIVLIGSGLPVSTTAIRRSDLEAQELAYDGAWEMQVRSPRSDAGPGTTPLPGLYPRTTWGIDPYLAPSVFDPDAPVRIDAGLDLTTAWEPAPGVILSGIIRAPLLGTLDESTRESTSVLPHVRSDAWLYDKADIALSRLTAAWYARPGTDLYTRVTAGLLEPMFGGVSAEVLWHPTDSRLAFGAEIAQVVQRDYDQTFDFRDYEVTTGHVSAYWDIGNGYTAQLDLGRYLAGDWGGTLTLAREFGNGWQLGLFATLTDVPFDDFGEGSFDKGLILTVPVSWASGMPTRDEAGFVLRPVLRDGGARLDVDGRLYETVHGATGAELAEGWGRFWR